MNAQFKKGVLELIYFLQRQVKKDMYGYELVVKFLK